MLSRGYIRRNPAKVNVAVDSNKGLSGEHGKAKNAYPGPPNPLPQRHNAHREVHQQNPCPLRIKGTYGKGEKGRRSRCVSFSVCLGWVVCVCLGVSLGGLWYLNQRQLTVISRKPSRTHPTALPCLLCHTKPRLGLGHSEHR